MLGGYSVIVPVLDKSAQIVRTLESVAASMTFLDEHLPGAEAVRGEVVVVDEGSTDGTVGLVEAFAQRHGRVRLVRHQRSLGVAAARNTGARMASGDVLFFCDGDDLYLPEHLCVGFWLLDRSAATPGNERSSALLRLGTRGHLAFDPARPVAAVRTGVRVHDALHPHWREAIDNTIAQNLCVRRACHDWGEGFPEEAVYKHIGGCEDAAYDSWLYTFFRVGRLPMETVEYLRYPGNSLDRQLRRFQHAPGSEYDVATPEQQIVHDIRRRCEEQKIGYLLDKWLVLGPPPLPAALLNWSEVVRELARRGRPGDAVRVAGQADEHGQPIAAEELDRLLASPGPAGGRP
jgi:glycosyltransferase involved in cell wall biosynthesis